MGSESKEKKGPLHFHICHRDSLFVFGDAGHHVSAPYIIVLTIDRRQSSAALQMARNALNDLLSTVNCPLPTTRSR